MADNGDIKVQCDTRIAVVNAYSGQGRLSDHHASGAYFHHLANAQTITFPPDFVRMATECAACEGDTVAGGVCKIVTGNRGSLPA